MKTSSVWENNVFHLLYDQYLYLLFIFLEHSDDQSVTYTKETK